MVRKVSRPVFYLSSAWLRLFPIVALLQTCFPLPCSVWHVNFSTHEPPDEKYIFLIKLQAIWKITDRGISVAISDSNLAQWKTIFVYKRPFTIIGKVSSAWTENMGRKEEVEICLINDKLISWGKFLENRTWTQVSRLYPVTPPPPCGYNWLPHHCCYLQIANNPLQVPFQLCKGGKLLTPH